MDLVFSISWCERVRECTLRAHWLSAISPRKVEVSLLAGGAKAANTSIAAALQIVILLISNSLVDYGSTMIFMCMPSWSSLQITVQTTSYWPGSEGAVNWNSWVPARSSRSQPGTLD